MPQRTPTHTSPFHQQITNNTGSSTSSANVNHNNNGASTGGGKGAFNQSTNSNANMSNTFHVQPNMLDSMNQGPKNMFLFHQSSSNNSSEMNSTCNNSITTPTNNTSLHFHNMNNQIVGNSSNKKRKHENVGASSSATNNTENAIFYHMETDFKRKHADKKRLVWTNDLHELFVKAVEQLGLQEARPKEILELMNLPDLTTTHIKSHLQKYRQQVKKGIIPTAGGSSLGSELGASDSETSEGVNEDVKHEQISSIANGTTMTNNMSSGNQNSIYSHHSNQSSSIPTIPNAQSSSQNFSSLNNSDQVNYIKNFLLHFNQIGSSANLRPNNDESTSGNNSSYGSSSSYQRPQLQQVTFANSITNNNITTVNQPLFQLGDGRSILQNCHLLTSANSLSEFLVLLQEICQTESDMGAIFNSLPVRSSNDLNLIVEGFRIGFICGMKFKPSQ